ncbi:helix-turn-helix domain-containing protein [Actinomyces sp. zg296]|uniref:helix-turn-helix domain-containing protein n=1 Tax=Actinomyces sp. zg296 TaxID=2609289 RepID=UPI001356ED8D|nr:helix-turn-helix domain-containing protein [Actinomyces sp. zg296]
MTHTTSNGPLPDAGALRPIGQPLGGGDIADEDELRAIMGERPNLDSPRAGAAMYALGDTSVARAARDWRDAQAREADAQDRLIGAIIAALRDGATKMGVCAEVGISRTTLDRWLAPRG